MFPIHPLPTCPLPLIGRPPPLLYPPANPPTKPPLKLKKQLHKKKKKLLLKKRKRKEKGARPVSKLKTRCELWINWVYDPYIDPVHILWILSAFTTGLALAMASRPWPLKSKLQSCFSGYRWSPQNVDPHRQVNPITPTFFLQQKHRFDVLLITPALADAKSASSLSTGSAVDDEAAAFDTTAKDSEEPTRESFLLTSFSKAFLAVAVCSSFIRKSLKHLEQRFIVAAEPKNPHPLAHRDGSEGWKLVPSFIWLPSEPILFWLLWSISNLRNLQRETLRVFLKNTRLISRDYD